MCIKMKVLLVHYDYLRGTLNSISVHEHSLLFYTMHLKCKSWEMEMKAEQQKIRPKINLQENNKLKNKVLNLNHILSEKQM